MRIFGRVLILLMVLTGAAALGQTPDSTSTSSNANSAATSKPPATTTPEKKPEVAKKPAKVWTNDDVGSLKGSVSVVGGKGSAKRQSTAEQDQDEENTDPHAERVRQYRDAIEQLRTQIDNADARIAQLKDFKAENGSPNGGINPNHGYNMVPPEEQVKQLEAKKKEMQAKIEDLENQARKEGIDPGELR